MLKFAVLAGLMTLTLAFDCGNEISIQKVGCFKRSQSVFPDMIANNRDSSHASYIGQEIDWSNFGNSMKSLACQCSQAAKEGGYVAFALGFYGECFAGKDQKALDDLLIDPAQSSSACINKNYGKCQVGENCIGEANAEYIYTFASQAPPKVDGGLSKWSEFTECSASCGEGAKFRERSCTNPLPQNGGASCEALGELSESQACKIKECPVNGQYGAWSAYSQCSKSCGGGNQKKTRKCDSPAPAHGGAECEGPAEDQRPCNTQACPVNGQYGAWSAYSQCSKSCGGGKQKKTRKCDSPAPAHGGAECEGPAEDERACNTQACPVNGKYGAWSAYSQCSKSCGGGKQKKTRKCDSPAPAHGGAACEGPAEDERACNTNGCPVNGKWGSYGSYGSCSKTCGGGSKSRSRSCNNPAPKNGGSQCSGSATQSATCNTQACLKSNLCSWYYTPFNTEKKGRPVYLDRHSLHCPSGYVMNYIKLQRNSGHTQIRYKYKCCRSQLTCSDSRRTNGQSYNGGGEGNTVYLDRQTNNCYNKGFSYLKLDRSGTNWNYKYDCCSVPSGSVSCYDTNTGYNDDGDGKVVYLDRHTMSCNTNYYITYFKLVRNSSHNKYKYDYRCCKLNAPAVTN
ncbi:properdin-like isoform X1 [Clytia hemisphaerica]|uniref:Uncharacterized protein n=1 Tax=Clytia hemisphaerica TaxID=252671 RepID=A0A7M5WTW9_9CNID